MVKICLVGGLGRMGRAIASAVSSDDRFQIVSVWESPEAVSGATDYARLTGYNRNAVALVSDGEAALGLADVVVEFSTPQVFVQVVEVCLRRRKPLVAGTTGIADKEAILGPLARKAAVVSSPNMAVGMNALLGVCDILRDRIGKLADVEIVEAHHRTKRDAPSGTALEIARRLGQVAGKPGVACGGQGGSRANDIVIHALRMGDVPGKHTVVFALKGETLELTHTASSRDCFARGALEAARFAACAPPGLYTMVDVITQDKPEV